MSKELSYEEISPYVFVTKLAGFEYSKYIQPFATKETINKNDIPMVQGKNIRNGAFVEKYDWFIKKEISDSLPRSVLNKKCILIPYVGSNLGEVGIFHNKYVCHLASNIAKVELNSDRYLLEYLMYYMQSKIGQSYLFQAKQGSSQPNITMESIRKTKIIKRTINEQKEIVKILSSIDNQINRNNEMVQKLQVLGHAIFNHFFSSEDQEVSLVNFPYIHILKPGITEFKGKKHYIATAEVEGEQINYDAPLIEYETRENRANMQPIPNSVWFAKMKHSIKHIYISQKDTILMNDCVFSTGFFGIKCDDITFEYIINYLNLSYFEKKKDLLAHGATMEGINNEDFKLFKIHLPLKEKLIDFHNKTKKIYYQISQINQMTYQLTCLKEKLLPLLINQQLA